MRLAALSLNDELVRAFERHADFAAAWAACERPDWLIELGLHAAVDRRLLVVVTAPIVERALERHSLPTAVCDLARRWARDEVVGAETWAAGFRVSEQARQHRGPTAAALRAAGALAFACDGSSSTTFYAIRGHLVDAIALALPSVADEAASFAALLRERLPRAAIEEALRKKVGHAEPPTRETGETPKKPYSWRPPVAASDDEG